MSFTAGQHQYLLELLSHEYVLTADQQPVVRQAICRYATTVYDQAELEFLLTLPQSPAACLYYHCSTRQFSQQYSLWLNVLEHAICQEMPGLEAVLLNPDPTSSQKLLALCRNSDYCLEAVPLSQLWFAPACADASAQQTPNADDGTRSRWTLQDARHSFRCFLQLAHCGMGPVEAEPLTWCDLLQQARLFPMVKDTYQMPVSYLPAPSASTWLAQLMPAHTGKHQSKAGSPSGHPSASPWLSQPPARPFQMEHSLFQTMKQLFSQIQPPAIQPPAMQRPAIPRPAVQPVRLPAFPAPPQIASGLLPPVPVPGSKNRMH